MTSITKILILITTIIAISGEVLDLSNDSDRSSARVFYSVELLDTLSHLKEFEPALRKGCYGSPIIECLGDKLIKSRYPEIRQPNEYMINKRGSRRERRQALVKTQGSDYGPNLVMSLLSKSNSPLRSKTRNRNRRSSSTPDISSNKNTTVEVRPKPVNSQPPKISNSKQLIITFLSAISSPYLLIY